MVNVSGDLGCSHHGAEAGLAGLNFGAQTMSISAAKDRLRELVGQSTITRNGAPAAALIGAQEWETLPGTLFWLTLRGIDQDLVDARRDQQ